MKFKPFFVILTITVLACGCGTVSRPGQKEPRKGDEIVAAGQFFHTGTPVVLWLDPGGYDAYRVERRFSPIQTSDWSNSCAEVRTLKTPNRYGLRHNRLTTNQIETVRGGGWDLPLLQSVVDQFVMHFDVCGTSRTCFLVLQDERDLSVHFMLDLDGTIYQTLDLQGAGLARDDFQRPLHRRGDRKHRRISGGWQQSIRPVVSNKFGWESIYHHSQAVWRWRHPHDKFYRASRTQRAGAWGDPGRRSGAI